MSIFDEVESRDKSLFGANAVVEEYGGWYWLTVAGRESLGIGRNGSEAQNALNLAEAAGLDALTDGMIIPNPPWFARRSAPPQG